MNIFYIFYITYKDVFVNDLSQRRIILIYKLFNEPTLTTMRQILYNRGIKTKEDQDK